MIDEIFDEAIFFDVLVYDSTFEPITPKYWKAKLK
jgi:hypothetical protein